MYISEKTLRGEIVAEIVNSNFNSIYGNVNFDDGILITPSEILIYGERLGLTASEYLLINWVFYLSNKNIKEIKDSYINSHGKKYTRQRKSLQAKGYLNIKTAKTYKKGMLVNAGIIYDFTGLKEAIEKLIEEDKAIEQMNAPVEIVYDEPSLFGEDVDTDPLAPKKLLRTESYTKENEERKDFLEKFKKLYEEVLGQELNYKEKTRYKYFLLQAFYNRKNDVNKAINITKEAFLKLPIEKRTYLKLQDIVKVALAQAPPGEITNIPIGIEDLLEKLEKGENINDAYKTFANTV